MKASKMTFIAAMALGSVLALGTAPAAETNASASTPPAGARAGRGGFRGPNLDQLATELKLTDEQKEKVKTVLDDQRTKMGELRNETDPEARRTKMQTLREDTNKKLKEILNADQYAQWEKMRQNGPRGPRNRGGGDGGNPPPADKKD